MKRLFYQMIEVIVGLALRFYFSKIEINGIEHVPDDGSSIIFTPNHQNAFLDAFIIGTFSPAPVHFLTRSDVFVPPFLWFFDALNMMPVYRIRDGYASLSKNEAIFKSCEELLAKSKPVLIFPEGAQEDYHYLRPLTKGTARLAMGTQDHIEQPLKVVPVGINFFRLHHPGHKLVLNYGPPIDVADYMEEYRTAKPHALNRFRRDLSVAIKALLVIPDATDDYLLKTKVFSRANEALDFATLRAKAANNDVIDEHKYTWLRVPILLLSLVNFGAHGLVYYLFRNVVKDRGFWASLKIALGMFYFPAWWLLCFLLVGFIFCFWPCAWLVLAIQVFCFWLRQVLAPLTR